MTTGDLAQTHLIAVFIVLTHAIILDKNGTVIYTRQNTYNYFGPFRLQKQSKLYRYNRHNEGGGGNSDNQGSRVCCQDPG